ncbi:MAG TPA: Calx-beta domain-containing protein, partial [Acidimicrobiia bacterium]|nr:Calx-beta domain-containing protein [Acidimicrobiia bacterium]
VTNPGPVSIHFAGQLTVTIAGSPVVIPGVTGDATGSIASDGTITLPQANVTFPPLPVLLLNAISTTVNTTAAADWTSSLDPDTGAMTLTAPLIATIDLSALGFGSACPLGPVTLALTTGTSGARTGTGYKATTGTAELVDGGFIVPAVPTNPAPPNCAGAASLDSLGQLPAGGVADFTATFGAPAPKGSPRISVGDSSILEGDTGTHVLQIPITLSAPTTGTTSVHYVVAPNTAHSSDFKPVSGTATFTAPAGGLSPVQKYVSIVVYGDKIKEANETLTVTLDTPTGGYILGRSVGTGTILNDDVTTYKLTVGVGNASVVVGETGNHVLAFPVTLSHSLTTSVHMHYAVSGISAVYGTDYSGTVSGTLTISAGARQGTIKVTVKPNATLAANKTLKVVLSSLSAPTGSKIVRATGTGTILAP